MKYRATYHPHDLHRAQSLLRAEGFPRADWRWPLAVAEENRHLRAAMGTRFEHGLLIGGPLVLDHTLGTRAPLVAYRLGRFYDRIMANLGIIRYYICVEAPLSQFKYILIRLGFKEVSDDGRGGTWFTKDAGHWGQVRVSDHEVPVDGLRQRIGAR